jgi:hypothetical protein
MEHQSINESNTKYKMHIRTSGDPVSYAQEIASILRARKYHEVELSAVG